MKKQTWLGMFGVVTITLACSFGAGAPATPTQADEAGTIVTTTMPALTAAPGESVSTQAAAQTNGTAVSFEYASFVIPDEMADGANPQAVPAVGEDGGAPWDVAPAHLKLTLTGYQLQDKFHEPGIFVYPADEFAQVHSGAAEQIERLKRALAGLPLLKETLPVVPFFNAAPLIAANIKIIPFQNGSGVRVLTEYAQYEAPINNHELFYHFQGLTDDGKYYVIVILPITAPILPKDEKPEAAIPEGGVPIPKGIGPNNVYYISVTERLNSLSSDSYTPSLMASDELIQSILVTDP